MPIIPALPGCGQPAVRRIEIYSPAGGRLHGSLDASAYACATHTSLIIDAIHEAGLTAYVVPGSDVGDRRCGNRFVFGDPVGANSGPGGPLPTDRTEPQRPIVQAAIADLHTAQATHETARDLLAMWSRRSLLTDVECETVLSDFPAPGSVPASRLAHPRWCGRRDCAERGTHRSTDLSTATGTIRGDLVGIDLALTRAIRPDDAETLVEIQFVDGQQRHLEVLELPQVHVLTFRLRHLLQLARVGAR